MFGGSIEKHGISENVVVMDGWMTFYLSKQDSTLLISLKTVMDDLFNQIFKRPSILNEQHTNLQHLLGLVSNLCSQDTLKN